MCGRFALSIVPAQFRRVFGVDPPEGYRPRWNITPDSDIVVVRSGDGGGRVAAVARWGLLGPWMRAIADPGRQINARVESAAEKPMFRDAFRRSRCLVPADGFYEWQKQPSGPSRPFFVRRADGQPAAFAGLWRRTRLADGTAVDSCAILTTQPSPSLRAIHPRMPLILPPEAFDTWLDPRLDDPTTLLEILEPLRDEDLAHHEVSRAVNSPRNDDRRLVEPLEEPPRKPAQGSLF